MTGIPDSTESKNLEQTVLKVYEELEVMVDPANVEGCHWVKTIFRDFFSLYKQMV